MDDYESFEKSQSLKEVDGVQIIAQNNCPAGGKSFSMLKDEALVEVDWLFFKILL